MELVWKLPLVATSKLWATFRLAETDILSSRAVYIHKEIRSVKGLLNPQIRHPRHVADLFQELIGDLSIGLQILAYDLNVDRRRQAEVERSA